MQLAARCAGLHLVSLPALLSANPLHPSPHHHHSPPPPLTTTTPLQDFYLKECWAHHPKPYADFMSYQTKEHERLDDERKKMVRV
jgi:hypothetical protein